MALFRILILLVASFGTVLGAEKVEAYGRCYSSEMEVERPKSIEQVIAIVNEARKSGKKISVIGAGFSQGKQYQYKNAILINLDKMNSVQVDKGILMVGAGARWKDVHAIINEKSLSLGVMQGSNIFSVGGSLSVNCHGWDHHKGSIINTVKEITIVNAQGQVQKLNGQDDLFYNVIGGYGAFGVIVEAKLELEKNQKIKEVSKRVEIKDYTDYFRKSVESDSNIVMHRYRLSLNPKKLFSYGIVTNYEAMGAEGVVSKLPDNKKLNRLIKAGLWIDRNMPVFKPLIWEVAKKQFLKEKISTRNEVMSPPVDLHFAKYRGEADWLQEFFLPEDELADFIKVLGKTLMKNNVKLVNATVRYVKKQDSRGLAYTPDKDRFAVVLFFRQSLKEKEIEKTQKWVSQMIDYCLGHDGIYYLPYHHFASKEQFHKSYSNWKTFAEEKQKQDPQSVFYSGFIEDYIECKKK